MYHELRKAGTSAVDLTFAAHPPRVLYANVKSKAPLASIVCWWSFDANIRKSACREGDANASIGPLESYFCWCPLGSDIRKRRCCNMIRYQNQGDTRDRAPIGLAVARRSL